MALRCLVFTSDSATAEPIRQVLDGLGVEGEHCSEAVTAVERVTQQSFQIVIIDWDKQPEAGVLLTAARERKAAERPLTLAIVSDDASVPQALQAGANSILRKPLLINQVNDTLTTARDLLRARLDSAQAAAAAAAAGPAPASPVASLPPVIGTSGEPSGEKILRVGEFLPSASAKPGAQFDTERDAQNTLDQSASGPVDPLRDLEPMAASVAEERPIPPPPPPPGEPRGLAWYLNARAAAAPAPAQSQPAPVAPASRPERPELLGYDQAAAFSNPVPSASAPASTHEAEPAPAEQHSEREHQRDQKNEAVLFAYMSGEEEPDASRKSRFHLGKGAIIGALALAACAIIAAPQAPWHDSLHGLWGRGKKATHAWLNPQPVTPVQAPVSHEDFGRAGDEYKLPVAENIPDATTDPSQIRVTPVVDPTIKKANNAQANPDSSNPDQSQPQPDAASPTDPAQPGASPPDSQPETVTTPTVTTPTVAQPPAGGTSSAPDPAPVSTPAVIQPQPHSDPPSVTYSPSVQPASKPQPHNVSATPAQRIPSSLKSQMASMAPDASGNKPPEAAMASFEPVDVPEATERGMLSDQPAIAYPPNAKGQQGTVVLQVLIGRDGTVQDAKFMQGSLAFARAAIDGVKQWKFKPYTMNGRPVSVQTTFTMNFKPGQ